LQNMSYMSITIVNLSSFTIRRITSKGLGVSSERVRL
jgi:hypothetical protein